MRRVAVIRKIGVIAGLLFIYSCGHREDPVVPPRTFRYVAVGDSLTAGFMDGGLIYDGQMGSYPALIASKLNLASAFTQPYIMQPGLGNSAATDGYVAGVLRWNDGIIELLGETLAADAAKLSPTAILTAPYGNLGVPGATVADVLWAHDSADSSVEGNKYFDLILRNSNLGKSTMAEQAIRKRPTIVTVWIGNNDILGGATSGDPVAGINMTNVEVFAVRFATLLAQLRTEVTAANGEAPIIVAANIPLVTDAPYFVPKALFDDAADGIVEDGNAAPVPTDESSVAFVRFPAFAELGKDGALPLSGEWTLTGDEAAAVADMVAAYNVRIAEICDAAGVGLADMRQLLSDAKTGTFEPLGCGHYGIYQNPTTIYSLDGIHPNNKGYALAANVWLRTIDEAAGTDLGTVDATAAVWDPTHGTGAASAPRSGSGRMTAEAAAAIERLFR